MSNLIELLTLETQTVKEQYLAQMQTRAEKQVVWNIARYEKYGRSKSSDYRTLDEYYTEQKWYYRSAGSEVDMHRTGRGFIATVALIASAGCSTLKSKPSGVKNDSPKGHCWTSGGPFITF